MRMLVQLAESPLLALAWPILPLFWPPDAAAGRRYGRRTLVLGLATLLLVVLLRGAFGSTPIHPKTDAVHAWRVGVALAHVAALAAGTVVAGMRAAQARSLDAWAWLGLGAAAAALTSLVAPAVGWPGDLRTTPIERLALAGAAAWPAVALAASGRRRRATVAHRSLLGAAVIVGVAGAAVALTRAYGDGTAGGRAVLLAAHAVGVAIAGYLAALIAAGRVSTPSPSTTALEIITLVLVLLCLAFGFLLLLAVAIPW